MLPVLLIVVFVVLGGLAECWCCLCYSLLYLLCLVGWLSVGAACVIDCCICCACWAG